jgi:hypothetical protein
MSMTEHPGETPETGIEESDPNADSPEGLAGEMGVSSERKGHVRGQAEEVAYGAAPTHPDEDDSEGDVPPEQSAYDGQPETNPDSPGAHKLDPDSNPGHGL